MRLPVSDGYPDPGMECPVCRNDDSRVIDSRPADGGRAIRRRRLCPACGHRFTTYERPAPVLNVRKRNGRVEPFDSQKVRRGIAAALADRPVSENSIEDLVEMVEVAVAEMGGTIESGQIGSLVLDRLRNLDEVAYLRFASVYKDFQAGSDFERELAELEGGPVDLKG